ncbi:MAG TPA: hypothetical protein VFA52_01915 [Candidatus Paceibacterota bacterium]|nr:hypothetical protein [Candidatus Paceibacterota bacterium]
MKSFNFNQRADRWVSTFVLVGCVLITAVLVFAAYKANALGGHLANPSAEIDSETF